MVRKTQGLMIMDNNLLGSFKPKRWFEEIKINQTLDPVYKIATKQQLVMYAGASRDFVPIHYDYQVAQNAGHDQVIIHGALKTAWLSQFVSQWAGLNSFIFDLSILFDLMLEEVKKAKISLAFILSEFLYSKYSTS